MERYFYNPINPELMVPEENRYWLNASNMAQVAEAIWAEPLDITYGGWGQDGHIAYNQARRYPFSQVTIEELRNSTIRLQENNIDTACIGPSHLRRSLPVCAANVGDTWHEGMPVCARKFACSAIQARGSRQPYG